jgi:hypothetical protein
MYTRTNMAGKLYWRVKKNNKWTWRAVTPAVLDMIMCGADIETAWDVEEE